MAAFAWLAKVVQSKEQVSGFAVTCYSVTCYHMMLLKTQSVFNVAYCTFLLVKRMPLKTYAPTYLAVLAAPGQHTPHVVCMPTFC